MSIILPGLCRFLEKIGENFGDEGEEVESLILVCQMSWGCGACSVQNFLGIAGTFHLAAALPRGEVLRRNLCKKLAGVRSTFGADDASD
jgi:hypothetical protein